MDKMLRRFCSQEVQILIAKLEEDYTLFTDYNNAWRRLLEMERCRTRIENYCVYKAKNRVEKNHDRQQYLARILKQQLVPQTVEEIEDEVKISSQQINNMKQQLGMHVQAHRDAVQKSMYEHYRNQIQGVSR